MLWRETCVMDQKIAFISAVLRDEAPMSALCSDFGISRNTGYKWLRRYRSEGPPGLEERSRAPLEHGRRMAPEIAAAILALRHDRPHWGPRKLRAILCQRQPQTCWPAASTIGDLLRRHGLSDRAGPAPTDFAAITAPNDLWCIDFKGWFRTRDGRRCDPLTVADAYSRSTAPSKPSSRRPSNAMACSRQYAPTMVRPSPPQGPAASPASPSDGSRPASPSSVRPPRALPPHPQTGNIFPASPRPKRAAAPLRCLLPRLQPQPPPRGARTEIPGQPLATLTAALSRKPRRALVRRKPCPPTRPQQRRDQVGWHQHLHQRDPRRREPRHRRNQRRRLARPLCRDRSRHHRHKKTETHPLPTAKRRSQARQQSEKTVTNLTDCTGRNSAAPWPVDQT